MKIEKIGLKDEKNKLRYELITLECLEGLAEVLTLGAKKYKPNSWQNVEDGIDKHYAALMRHLIEWKKGEYINKDSGYSHMKHVLANAMFLLYHERNYKKND